MATILETMQKLGSVTGELARIVNVEPNNDRGGYISPSPYGMNIEVGDGWMHIDHLDGMVIRFGIRNGEWQTIGGTHYDNRHTDRTPRLRVLGETGGWSDWRIA